MRRERLNERKKEKRWTDFEVKLERGGGLRVGIKREKWNTEGMRG